MKIAAVRAQNDPVVSESPRPAFPASRTCRGMGRWRDRRVPVRGDLVPLGHHLGRDSSTWDRRDFFGRGKGAARSGRPAQAPAYRTATASTGPPGGTGGPGGRDDVGGHACPGRNRLVRTRGAGPVAAWLVGRTPACRWVVGAGGGAESTEPGIGGGMLGGGRWWPGGAPGWAQCTGRASRIGGSSGVIRRRCRSASMAPGRREMVIGPCAPISASSSAELASQ